MNRVIYFEIPVDEPERARQFYSSVFGWKIEKLQKISWDYWSVMTAEEGSAEYGINGGMFKRMSKRPEKEAASNAFVGTILVDDFDAMAEKILAAGGLISMAKFPIPGQAWQGYFLDTEGNMFGVHQLFKEDQ